MTYSVSSESSEDTGACMHTRSGKALRSSLQTGTFAGFLLGNLAQVIFSKL